MKIVVPSLVLVGLLLPRMVVASEQDRPDAQKASGWEKYEKNPVLGGSLGTCFDVTVLRETGKYRMWFSWRPKRSIALVESKEGLAWGEPAVVLGPNPASGWEGEVNRPVVLKEGD